MKHELHEATPARPRYWSDYVAHTKSRAYRDRLETLIREGCDHSDAEGVADAEFLEAWHEAHPEEARL